MNRDEEEIEEYKSYLNARAKSFYEEEMRRLYYNATRVSPEEVFAPESNLTGELVSVPEPSTVEQFNELEQYTMPSEMVSGSSINTSARLPVYGTPISNSITNNYYTVSYDGVQMIDKKEKEMEGIIKKGTTLFRNLYKELYFLRKDYFSGLTNAYFSEEIDSLKRDKSIIKKSPIISENGFFVVNRTIYFIEEDTNYKKLFNGSLLNLYTKAPYKNDLELDALIMESIIINNKEFIPNITELSSKFEDQSIVKERLIVDMDLKNKRSFFGGEDYIRIEDGVANAIDPACYYAIENMFHYKPISTNLKISIRIQNIGFNLKEKSLGVLDFIEARDSYWETARNPSKNVYDFYTNLIEANKEICETYLKKKEFEESIYKKMGFIVEDDSKEERVSPRGLDLNNNLRQRLEQIRMNPVPEVYQYTSRRLIQEDEETHF